MNIVIREIMVLTPFVPLAAAFVLAFTGAYVGE